MKGTLFVIFEKFVIHNWGEDGLEELMELCPHVFVEPFISPENYPDQWMTDMLLALCGKLNVTPESALHSLGKFAFPELYRYAPVATKTITHPLPFLLLLHGVIHVEVRKLMKEVSPPGFTYEQPAPDQLIMHYHSNRQLCYLAEGILDGVAEHFQVPIQRKQTSCTHRGDSSCVFLLQFATVP
ncbi:MAG: hypothetical protein ACJAYU_001712 [Bradymonadia bacterium]|jgi:hypothetical protein